MSKDVNQPATKVDIEELARITDGAIQKATEPIYDQLSVLQSSVGELKSSVKEIQKEVGSFKRGQQAVLIVVQSIDEQLKHHRNLPERVARLERATFR